MANGMNDDRIACYFIKDQIRKRRCGDTPDCWIVCLRAEFRMGGKQVNNRLKPGVDTCCALRRLGGDVFKDSVQLSERRSGIAQPHRPCLAQIARTSSSVAKSPRSAAALDFPIAARSSLVRGTGISSPAPASCMMARAMSSCSSAGRRRAASMAVSRSFVMFLDSTGSSITKHRDALNCFRQQ